MEHAKHAPLFQWTVFVDVIPVPRTKQLSSLTEPPNNMEDSLEQLSQLMKWPNKGKYHVFMEY